MYCVLHTELEFARLSSFNIARLSRFIIAYHYLITWSASYVLVTHSLPLTLPPSLPPPHTPPPLTSSLLHFLSSHPPPSTLVLFTPSPLNPSPLHTLPTQPLSSPPSTPLLSPLNPSPLHSRLSFPSTLLSMQLFDIVVRYDTLRNVINSVTRNLKSIVLTAILALILIFLYSIFGYVFFPDDFLLPTHPKEAIEYTCSDDGEWL